MHINFCSVLYLFGFLVPLLIQFVRFGKIVFSNTKELALIGSYLRGNVNFATAITVHSKEWVNGFIVFNNV